MVAGQFDIFIHHQHHIQFVFKTVITALMYVRTSHVERYLSNHNKPEGGLATRSSVRSHSGGLSDVRNTLAKYRALELATKPFIAHDVQKEVNRVVELLENLRKFTKDGEHRVTRFVKVLSPEERHGMRNGDGHEEHNEGGVRRQ